MKILLLIDDSDAAAHNDHRLLGNAVLRAGHDLHLGSINSIAYRHGAVHAAVTGVPRRLEPGERCALRLADRRIDDMDLIWVMSRPRPAIQLDTYQLLWLFEGRCRFVNAVSAVVFVNGKSVLEAVVGVDHIPETHVAAGFEALWQQFRHGGGDWMVKPSDAAASARRLSQQDPNAEAILKSMTDEAGRQRAAQGSGEPGAAGRYCVLQRYAPAALRGQKRVVLAGGDVVASYRCVPPTGDDRSDRLGETAQEACGLSERERRLCNALGRMLLGLGVAFAAADIADPYLLALDIVDPTGLAVFERLTGKDMSDLALAKILTALDFPMPVPAGGTVMRVQERRAGE